MSKENAVYSLLAIVHDFNSVHVCNVYIPVNFNTLTMKSLTCMIIMLQMLCIV